MRSFLREIRSFSRFSATALFEAFRYPKHTSVIDRRSGELIDRYIP